MKINKVLLGLFAGVLALMGGTVKAQFYEVGPANVGGCITSLIVDQQDESRTTVYAGAISGGLYVRTSNSSVLQNLYSHTGSNVPVEELSSNFQMWHYVPCLDANGNEMAPLPISAMMQAPDGTIFIGTGDNTFAYGNTYNSKMSMKGRGIYRYNATEGTFKILAKTSPNLGDVYTAVRAMDFYKKNDTMYLFVATSTGLYRWAVKDGQESGWDANPTLIMAGDVDNILVSRPLNIAYFSIGNQLYRMGNAIGSTNAINISTTNPAFGGKNTHIRLAMAPTDNRYLYAMVLDSNYYMENIYLTTNGQQWTTLTTSSVDPLSYTSGVNGGTMTVDPTNPKRLIVGGTDIWIGVGYVEGANYMWTSSSYSEFYLNRGDYMGSVFNSTAFVHSGIRQIVPVWSDEEGTYLYYIATNGGVFSSTSDFYRYNNLNRGLNNVQITGLAVCPDGSLISGAVDNSCPFIEARLDHDGGRPLISWYDYGTMGNMNHDANVLWTSGSGGKVAASSFYQVLPKTLRRRNIFVSSYGHMGRSYNDYLDYNNPTTWTVDSNFLTLDYTGGRGNIVLWENENDTYFKDSVLVGFDLRGYYFHNGDTTWIKQDTSIKLVAGDKAIFMSKANSGYPFEFEFTADFLNAFKAAHGDTVEATVADSFLVKSPVVSHAFAIVNAGSEKYVTYCWTPNDFTRVWDHNVANMTGVAAPAEKEKMIKWAPIFSPTGNDYPREMAVSNDGRFLFVSTYNVATHKSQLYRIKGFEDVNYHQASNLVINELKPRSTQTKMTTQAFSTTPFDRPISSIAVDPRPGSDRIVVTFEEYNSNGENVIVIDNATKTNWTASGMPLSIGDREMPVYSSMIEDSLGYIYVGTAEGVYVHNGANWVQYRHLKGIPVTSIVQQTKKLPTRRSLSHTGIDVNKHVFAKTKWPRAIYFGTYGRGIFMDTTYVTDTENEICDTSDYLSIPTVATVGVNSVTLYPNPVMGEAHLAVSNAEAGNAVLRVYDLNGRCVVNRNLGYAKEGELHYTLGTEGMAKGMYLVNVIIGGHTAAAKMIVR